MENNLLKQRIVLTLTEGEPLVRVNIHSPNALSETGDGSAIAIDRSFTATFQAVSGFFSDDWCTGFLSVTEDGPVYMKSSGGMVTVLIQRRERFDQTLRWYDDAVYTGCYTPNVLFKFFLVPKDPSKGLYRIDLSRIYLMDGAFLGEKTVLRSARRLCNVFDDSAVCWGRHDSANGGDVTIPSLTNMVGEFFRLPFNGDLHPDFDFWHRLKKNPELALKEANIGTVADIIGD